MTISKYQPSKDEIAAAMAAVFAYMQAETSLQAVDSKSISNGWYKESLLQGCLLINTYQHPQKLSAWQTSSLNKLSYWTGLSLLTIWLVFAANTRALAQNLQSSQQSSEINAPLTQAALPSKQIIRVGLVLNASSSEIGAPDGATVKDIASGNTVANLPPQGRWKLGTTGDTIAFIGLNEQSKMPSPADQSAYINVLYTPSSNNYGFNLPFINNRVSDLNAQSVASNSGGFLISSNSSDGLIAVNGKLYRGEVSIVHSKSNPNAFNIINLVAIEDYLLSVVPSEMPSSWPIEALKAQAIAARSYALANLGKNGLSGFDVRATTDDQVYSGISSESESSNNAVAQTASVVLKHDNKVIPAFFHSTSGGYTEDAQYVWKKSIPFLQAVPDYDDASPHFSWTQKFSTADTLAILHKNNVDIGSLENISVITKSPALRAMQIMVTGDSGNKILSAGSVQRIFNLRSTSFTVFPDNDGYVFYGRGWGHGLGMSQWGAKALAEHGYNAAQILTYYYKDTFLEYF